MIGVLIGIIIYILIGCIIDLLITKGKEKPNIVMALIWPFFLIICLILLSTEESEEKYDAP